MTYWYKKIVLEDDFNALDGALDHYECELLTARDEVKIAGNLEQAASRLPAIFEYRYSQLQEVEAIVKYLEIELDKTRSKHFRKYLEKYNRDLSSRDAEKFSAGEQEVVDWQKLVNTFHLVRNRYLGLMKSLDHKNWQISNITKLRVAGMEDSMI